MIGKWVEKFTKIKSLEEGVRIQESGQTHLIFLTNDQEDNLRIDYAIESQSPSKNTKTFKSQKYQINSIINT